MENELEALNLLKITAEEARDDERQKSAAKEADVIRLENKMRNATRHIADLERKLVALSNNLKELEDLKDQQRRLHIDGQSDACCGRCQRVYGARLPELVKIRIQATLIPVPVEGGLCTTCYSVWQSFPSDFLYSVRLGGDQTLFCSC